MFEIPFVRRQIIQKGWSGDRKYCAADAAGKRYLLRISPAAQYESKRIEFEQMQKVEALGINMCRPLAFGVCPEGVYSIQSWIDGSDAESVLPHAAADAQYAYGLNAGSMLRTMHQLPAPDTTPAWPVRFNRKADAKILKYRQCALAYENGQAFIDYIQQNRSLLDGRPNTYQHGDYHIGNMMIGRDRQLYIIDFNRSDFGDPWEEFNRIVWCAQAAPAFARGMVDGYFDGAVPMAFWRLLALYISSNTLGSLPWAVSFGEKEIRVMQDQAKMVLQWYDGMKNPVPSWYTQDL